MACRKCQYYGCEGIEGRDYWWPECRRPENSRLSNLKSFPFKTKRPCFQLSFWHSEFADMVDGSEESLGKALKLYREKYETEVGEG